ncbi:hypothetical protein GQ42DRAFT_125838 [Ramicandelaber brevisporus]|nr:hypothetical protein GQ42DRAFT_125838 [Ramicandelaber brevisporus]
MVNEVDPDAPLRENGKLHAEDARYENALMKSVFMHLRRGDVASAVEACRLSDQPWRAASLLGSDYFRNEALMYGSIDVTSLVSGNPTRGLFREMCHNIASDPAVDKYERAVYARLCGDEVNMRLVCETWADHLWAHFCSLVDDRLEEWINQCIPNSSLYSHQRSKEGTSSSTTALSSSSSVATAAALSSSSVSRSPFHEIQTKLMIGQPTIILDDYAQHLGQRQLSYVESLGQLLRFMAHLTAFLRAVDVNCDPDAANSIIGGYIDMLIGMGLNDLVIKYVALLSAPELRIETYAAFLTDLDCAYEARSAYLEHARNWGLDSLLVARKVVSNIFDISVQFVCTLPTVTEAIQLGTRDPSAVYAFEDARLIRVVEWLMLEPRGRFDAINQTCRLARWFLMRGRVASAYVLINTLLERDVIPSEWLAASRIASLSTIHEMADGYQRLIGSSATSSASAPVLTPAKWQQQAQNITSDTAKLIQALLESDWLGSSIFSGELTQEAIHRNGQLIRLREIYIPHVVFLLHEVLFSTRDIFEDNLIQSCAIVRTVAHPQNGLYVEFMKTGQLPKLLNMVRISVVAMMQAREQVQLQQEQDQAMDQEQTQPFHLQSSVTPVVAHRDITPDDSFITFNPH